MPLKVVVEVETPLSPEDSQLLAGLGMTLVAIATRDQPAGEADDGGDGEPGPGDDEEGTDGTSERDGGMADHEEDDGPGRITITVPSKRMAVPFRCASRNPDDGHRCVGLVGHRGAHHCRASEDQESAADLWGPQN